MNTNMTGIRYSIKTFLRSSALTCMCECCLTKSPNTKASGRRISPGMVVTETVLAMQGSIWSSSLKNNVVIITPYS